MSVHVKYHEDAEKALFSSRPWRQFLDRIGFAITGHAIPYSGVDTGALVGSMSHDVEVEDGRFIVTMGSGARDGVPEVWYAAPHWAKKQPTIPAPSWTVRRKRVPHPTKPAPTRPWAKALRALGIDYQVEPGGYEA